MNYWLIKSEPSTWSWEDQINSETGNGVIFPSWLQHWVPSNTDERITISWNVIVRGEYGEPQTLQNARI